MPPRCIACTTLRAALLYIGVTDAPAERMVQHAKTQSWWHAVGRKTMVWYPRHADA